MPALSIKEYAIKHRLTIYNVVRMAKRGELPTETREVDGKEELFIISDEAPDMDKQSSGAEEIVDYKKAYFELKAKYDALLKRRR